MLLPIAGIFWTVIYGLPSDKGEWLSGTIPLLIACSPLVNPSLSITEPISLFVFSLWLQRTSFLLAERWMMNIVMNHYEAYEMMEQHIHTETH